MNFRTTLVLLVLVLAAGAVLFFSRGKMTTHEVEEQIAKTYDADGIPAFAAGTIDGDNITTLKITLDDVTHKYVKENGKWYQHQPVWVAVNEWEISKLIENVASLKFSRKLDASGDDGVSMKQAGLDQPRAEITLTEGDKSIVIQIGKRGMGGNAYAMLSNASEMLVTNDHIYKHVVDAGLEKWRSKSLDCIQEANADWFAMKIDGQSFACEKLGGQWYFAHESKLAGRVDADTVSQLLSGTTSVYLTDFAPDANSPADLALYGLDKPAIEMTVRKPAGEDQSAEQAESRTLRIGIAVDAEAEKYYASWSRGDEPGLVVFEMNSDDVKKYQIAPDAMRDPRIITLAGTDIGYLVIDRPQQRPLRLDKSSEGWAFGKPGPAYAADSGAAGEFADLLADTRAEGYIADYQPTRVLAEVEVGGVGIVDPQMLTICPADDDSMLVVVRNEESTGYVVSRDRLADVLAGPIAFRERTVLDFAADKLQKITATQSDGETIELIRSQDGTWAITSIDAFEKQAVDNLIASAALLRAEKWTEAGEVNGSVKLAVEATDGQTAQVLIDPKTRLATSGADMPFVVSQSTIDTINAEFRERTVLSIERADIESVTVTKEEKSLTLTVGEDGAFAADSGQAVDQEKAGKLFDLLTDLQVIQYVGEEEAGEAMPVTVIEVKLKAGQVNTISLHGMMSKDNRFGQLRSGETAKWFTVDPQTENTLTGVIE